MMDGLSHVREGGVDAILMDRLRASCWTDSQSLMADKDGVAVWLDALRPGAHNLKLQHSSSVLARLSAKQHRCVLKRLLTCLTAFADVSWS